MHIHLAMGIIGLAAATSPVLGQAFNIDLGAYANTVAASDYGAAAGQMGYWNYYIQGDDKLRDLAGNPTSVQLFQNPSNSANIPGLTGNEERFMESFNNVTPAFDGVSLFGLAPGLYDCYIYSWMGPVFGNATVSFTLQAKNNKAFGQVTYDSPAWPGGQLQGVTYDRVRIEVPANALALDIRVGMTTDFQILNGIQIVPVPAPAAALPLMIAGAIMSRRRR